MKKAVRKYFTVAREETLSLVNTLTNCCEYGWNIWRKRVHVRLISCNDIAVEDAFCWTVGYCLRDRRYEGDIGWACLYQLFFLTFKVLATNQNKKSI